MEIWRENLGDQHPRFAFSLNNLAGVYLRMGDLEQAEPLLVQCLGIREKSLGKMHPDYAASLSNLASVYLKKGEYSRAKFQLEQAVSITEKVLGDRHPSFASDLNTLCSTYMQMGDYKSAEPLCIRVRDIRKKELGVQHPDFVQSTNDLATLYLHMGEYTRADPLFKMALDTRRRLVDKNAPIQSERQQRLNQVQDRFYLDGRISNSLSLPERNDKQIATDIWCWKGLVTDRQIAYRRIAKDPKLAPSFEKLRLVTQKLSVEYSKIPISPPAYAHAKYRESYRQKRKQWEALVAKLTNEREELEQKIASVSKDFRRTRTPLSIQLVRNILPEKAVLIDFLEYVHSEPNTAPKKGLVFERRYLATIVPKAGSLRIVELGSAELIHETIIAFRSSLTVPNRSREKSTQTAEKLRENLWVPLEEHLDGVETVVISPDTVLGTMPFGALPGETPSQFLIEDYKLVSIPYASLLRRIFVEKQAGEPRLLVLGDVDYNSPKSPSAQSAAPNNIDSSKKSVDPNHAYTKQKKWNSLPGFKIEFDSVVNLFWQRFGNRAEVKKLSGKNATEDSFLDDAVNCSTLHLITHGFFTDPKTKSLSQTEFKHQNFTEESERPGLFFKKRIPGLLSGLVMAGANNAHDSPSSLDDGVLRSAEIEASILRNVELVVLSACDTGLGPVAGGEGLTGLQRAFHVAGANSVIASLWKVDDFATQELMKQFYTNLWIKKQSKVDALRNAQLWMLNHARELEARLVKDAANRGDVRVRRKPTIPGNIESPGRTDPYFWAAFQLSGDWR